MTDPEPASRSGWKAHGAILLVGLLLGVPVAIADAALLGPSHGGWISLDFRGLLIGAYAALWVSESLLATIGVAILRGRSGIGAIGAHVAAVAVIVVGLAAGWGVWQARDQLAHEAHERERRATLDRAPDDLSVVRWSRVGEGARVTFRANAPGELGVEYARRPDAYVAPYPEHRLATGEELTLDLEVDDYASGGDGDYFFIAWATDGFQLRMRSCRPACRGEPDDDLVLLELPAPEG